MWCGADSVKNPLKDFQDSVQAQITSSEQREREIREKLRALPDDRGATRKVFSDLAESESKLQRDLRQTLANRSKTSGFDAKGMRYLVVVGVFVGVAFAILNWVFPG
jgi:Flp pilus assembly protein TadB